MSEGSIKKKGDENHSFEQLIEAVEILAIKIPKEIKWAIDGSMSLALQGYVDLTPNDIDILTDEHGAYAIGKIFSDKIVKEVQFGKTEKYESHFGGFKLGNVSVEIMGNLRVYRNGSWSVQQNPETVEILNIEINGHTIPVVSLKHQRGSGYLKERTE